MEDLVQDYGHSLGKVTQKQYLSLDKNSQKSLLQNTKERINSLKNLIDPILICNEEHRFIVAEQMREINTKPLSILLEPFGRNTAPAIALAAIKALENHKDAVLLVLSSDHEVKDQENFVKVIEKGLNYALQDNLVTFGIVPTKPETGYGYIKAEAPLINQEVIGKKISEFTEKPDLKTAEKFIKDKCYTWNSGIFMFKAQTIIDEIKSSCPEIFETCNEAMLKSQMDLEFQRLNQDSFLNVLIFQ